VNGQLIQTLPAQLTTGVATTLPAQLPGAAVTIPAEITQVSPNCQVLTEELEIQTCNRRAETVCETTEVVNQHISYEKRCKDVTSRHCPTGHALVGSTVLLKKREAEAEPQFFGLNQYPSMVYQPTSTTVRHACTEVTNQHCVDTPVSVDQVTPVEKCHLVQKVDCLPAVQRIPKTVCEPVETTVVHQQPLNPLAYVGKK
jgi:hypothetical protein